MTWKLNDEEFIKFLATGEIQTRLGDVVQIPDSMTKKGSGELNAEKTMMLVLKARADRRQLPAKQEPKENPAIPEPVK